MRRAIILGCGSAGGVPSISRGWGECDPENPKNRRLRPSILIESDTTRILVDTSPDCREQLLSADVRRLDAVLYTHDHADHVHGIDDLREVNRAMQAALDIHATPDVLASLTSRFPYVVGRVEEGQSIYKPMLNLRPLTGPFAVGDIDVVPFDQDHGFCRTTGFRFGPLAYSTDVVELPDEAFEVLAGIDTWVVACLTLNQHPTHAHLDKVLDWHSRLNPRRMVLTHMTPSLDYNALKSLLPDGVEPAYDGLKLDVQDVDS
jgi:phosphoribosyl 1,2-cyclic phosphate phosphodiesterase